MCDDFTEHDNARWLAAKSLSRRDFGRASASAAAIAALPGCMTGGSDKAAAAGRETMARSVMVPTSDGQADAFFVAPKSGRHPGVILWPDIAGLRDAYKTMATRLAGEGYAVLVVNHYYRSSRAPIVATMAEWRTPEGQARIKPMIAAITLPGIASDARAFVTWLDAQREVDTGKQIAALGYCMTGPYTLRTAAAVPARIGAACSFHGAGLVDDTPDSPHLLIPKLDAALLLAIAQNDDERQPDAKDVLRKTAADAGRKAEVEVYPAQHGWCTIDSPVYDEPQAERAWARMLATLSANL